MGYPKWPKQSMAAWNNKLLRTLFLVNLAGIMERADEALLPSVYQEIALTLHASPTRLGSLTLLRSIVQVICFPLAAFMSMHHNRANVIALGAMLWAIATFFVGASSTFLEVAISRALTGIGLAMVIPAIQSMVADAADPASRGLAFGWLQFTGSFGGIFGHVFALLLADTTVFGLAGWRASFHIIAMLSVLVAFLVLKYAIDPRFTENMDPSNSVQGMMSYDNASTLSSTLKETFEEAKNVMRIPTFLAIVGQGVIGSFPSAAMSFAPMWLELIGFSHKVTATIIGLFIASTSLGGLFGGWLGDVFARHLPNTGRIILAQFSSGIGVPFGAVLLLFLPYDSSTAFLHGAVFCSMGLLRSWCATATNDPILAEIVPEKSRTSVYALDRSIESILSSFAPPLVGILAQYVFGYVDTNVNVDVFSSPSHANVDTQNAAALGKALYVAFGIPYAICCLIYSFLYWTYPKDRDKALAAAQLESHLEMSSGATQCFNSKLGYVSLKQDADCTKAQLQNNEDPNNLESSREEEHMLSNTG